MSEVFKIQTHDANLGITTTVHRNDNGVSIEKTWDAAPILEEAKRERELSAGESWGEFRKVGIIPMAVYATFLRQDGGFDKKRCLEWIRQNPAFCTFDKALK